MPFTMMEMMKGSAMEKRRRVKHEKTFEERLAEEALTARELLLRRARQVETAAHVNEWPSSSGLQPPASLENLLSDQKK